MTPVAALVAAAALTWIMLLAQSLGRAGGVGPKALELGVGNRENIPPPSGFAGRADRAAKNMLENLLLFVTVMVAAMTAGVPHSELSLPCILFLVARAAYAPIYWAGIKVVRTVAWAAAVFAMAWIGALAMGLRI